MSVPWTITAGVRSSHLTGRHMARIAMLVMAMLVAGCAEITFQQYPGPVRPDADVSIVRLWTARTKNIFVTPGLIVEKIDGVEAGSVGRTSHAYVLPGEHEFQVHPGQGLSPPVRSPVRRDLQQAQARQGRDPARPCLHA